MLRKHSSAVAKGGRLAPPARFTSSPRHSSAMAEAGQSDHDSKTQSPSCSAGSAVTGTRPLGTCPPTTRLLLFRFT